MEAISSVPPQCVGQATNLVGVPQPRGANVAMRSEETDARLVYHRLKGAVPQPRCDRSAYVSMSSLSRGVTYGCTMAANVRWEVGGER